MTARPVSAAVVAAVAALALVVTGCGGGGAPPATATAAQALSRLDGYLQRTLTGARTGPHFTRSSATTTYQGGCVRAGGDSDFTGQVEAQVDYLTSTDTVSGFIDATRSYWSGQGYPVTSDANHLDTHTGDQYHLFVTYYPAVHELHLGGSSPCTWPNGTPPTR